MNIFSPFANPVYYTAVNGNLTSVCYCYRTVHSVHNFYMFSGILFAINITVCLVFFVFGDRFFEGKYRKELSTETGVNRHTEWTTVVE